MNLLLISEYFPPDQVGASTRISILVKELVKDHDVTVITGFPHYPKPDSQSWTLRKPIKVTKEKNLKMIRIWMPVFNMATTAGRIVNYAFFTVVALLGFPFVENKPDIIWGTSPNVFCGFTARMARWFFGGGTTLANIDDIWPEGPTELGFLQSRPVKWMGEILARTSVKGVDALTTISDTITRYYIKKYHLSRVFTIPVGFDHDKLEEFIHVSKNVMLGGDKTPKKEFTFMYSGILGPAYDFELMLDALALMKDSSRVRLLVRGTGPLKEQVARLMKRKGLPNAVLDTRYLSIEELHRTLLGADAFVLPMVDNFISKTALPTKLFEYMSLGKPVVLYGKGEPRALVENASAGIICEGVGAARLAESMQQMVDATQRQEWGRNGQVYIKSYYSSRIVASMANAMFKTLLSLDENDITGGKT